jgi:hypothetical protein
MVHKSLRLSSAHMIIKVKIEFRDDTEKFFDCWEFPYISDWITLYLLDSNRTRLVIPRDGVKSIKYW